jgi:polygalacturonase
MANLANAQLSKEEKQKAMDEIVNRIELPVIPDYTVSVTKFGAKGDSVTNNKPAFDKAMKDLAKRKGGTLVVPKGFIPLTGPFIL